MQLPTCALNFSSNAPVLADSYTPHPHSNRSCANSQLDVMAEIVGTVASVTQLVQLSGALLAGGYSFLSKVARAPSEIRGLLTETAAVNSLLAQLQQIADSVPKNASDDALQALERVGVFQECQTILKSIEKALAKCEQVNGQDARNLGKKLMWPFKEKETKDALQRLHHMRGLLANAIDANSA